MVGLERIQNDVPCKFYDVKTKKLIGVYRSRKEACAHLLNGLGFNRIINSIRNKAKTKIEGKTVTFRNASLEEYQEFRKQYPDYIRGGKKHWKEL